MEVPESGQLNPSPPQMFVPAESEDMVPDLIAANTTSNNGQGDWYIDITLLNAGGRVLGEEPNNDHGNTWILTITCYYYIPVITQLD